MFEPVALALILMALPFLLAGVVKVPASLLTAAAGRNRADVLPLVVGPNYAGGGLPEPRGRVLPRIVRSGETAPRSTQSPQFLFRSDSGRKPDPFALHAFLSN